MGERKVELDPNGKFTTTLLLKLGINTIPIIAQDKAGNQTKIDLKIELVKTLPKQKEEKTKPLFTEKKRSTAANFLATLLSIGIIVGVLAFFLK